MTPAERPVTLSGEQIAARVLHWEHAGDTDICARCSHRAHVFADQYPIVWAAAAEPLRGALDAIEKLPLFDPTSSTLGHAAESMRSRAAAVVRAALSSAAVTDRKLDAREQPVRMSESAAEPLRGALEQVRRLRWELVDADDAPESSVWMLDQVLAIFDRAALEATAPSTPALDVAKAWRHATTCVYERGGDPWSCNCGLDEFRSALTSEPRHE